MGNFCPRSDFRLALAPGRNSRPSGACSGATRGERRQCRVARLAAQAGQAAAKSCKVANPVADNTAFQKDVRVRAWLARHPRWTLHFTPTSCSWLNAVEGFFAKLTRRRMKHGVFRSVVELQGAINRFVAEHNDREPKPFVWRADPDAIIAARTRGFQALESNH